MGTIKDNKQRKMVDATRIKCGILGASRVKCPKGNSSFKVASTSFPFLRILWSQKWSPLFTMMLNKNFCLLFPFRRGRPHHFRHSPLSMLNFRTRQFGWMPPTTQKCGHFLLLGATRIHSFPFWCLTFLPEALLLHFFVLFPFPLGKHFSRPFPKYPPLQKR